MRIVVLGSAAGGGFPQWNCNAPTSRGVRSGTLRAKPRTQAAVAVSADGERWLLLDASPDLRQQVLATPALWPQTGLRHSPIEAVILTSGEIDHVAGLLSMRESQPFALWAAAPVLEALAANPIFDALSPRCVDRHTVAPNCPFPMTGPSGGLGLTVTAFPVPGKVPLYLEHRAGPDLAGAPDETLGLEIACHSSRFHYVPGCAAMTAQLRERLRGSPLVFFDGTLWRDDELISTGAGSKTGRRMGHMCIDGPDGTIAAFADFDVRRKILIHVNTTNPILDEDSPERAILADAGWEVAEDGMQIAI